MRNLENELNAMMVIVRQSLGGLFGSSSALLLLCLFAATAIPLLQACHAGSAYLGISCEEDVEIAGLDDCRQFDLGGLFLCFLGLAIRHAHEERHRLAKWGQVC